MPNDPTADDFRRLLKRRGVKLNTLHAALRVPYLDERKRHYFRCLLYTSPSPRDS